MVVRSVSRLFKSIDKYLAFWNLIQELLDPLNILNICLFLPNTSTFKKSLLDSQIVLL